jgi:hypothetical protein
MALTREVAVISVADNGDGTFHVSGVVHIEDGRREISYDAPAFLVRQAINMAVNMGALT